MSDSVYYLCWGIVNIIFAAFNIYFTIENIKNKQMYSISLFAALLCGSIGIADIVRGLI